MSYPDYLYRKDWKINASMLTLKYFQLNFPEIYKEIVEKVIPLFPKDYIPSSDSEYIYVYYNKFTNEHLCHNPWCKKVSVYKKFTEWYLDYCSKQCRWKHITSQKKWKKVAELNSIINSNLNTINKYNETLVNKFDGIFFKRNWEIDSNKTKELWIKTHKSDFYNKIIKNSEQLDISFWEKLFLYINWLNNIPLCKTCWKQLSYKWTLTKWFWKYCNNKCGWLDTEVQSTKMEWYKLKLQEIYGEWITTIFKTEEFKEKAKKTSLKKYNTEFVSQAEIVKEKAKKTVIKKYWSKQELWKLTYKKAIKTLQEKHNDIKIINLMDSPNAKKNLSIKVRTSNLDSYMEKLKEKNISFLSTKEDYINNWSYAEYDFQCNKCNHIFKTEMSYNYFASCPVCSKNKYNSKLEEEICEYIYSLDKSIKIITNDRKILNGLELDIYLPDYNIAIEFDWLMYHSIWSRIFYRDDNTSSEWELKNYHLNKTELCLEKNIQLFHIFENEWIYKNTKDIWKSIIANKLWITNRIYARNTIIKEVGINESKEFILKNHLQWVVNAWIKIWLFYDNELVSLMTFWKSRYNTNFTYELVRYVNKKWTSIVWWASKIFHYFNKNFLNSWENIITYGDKRFSIGKIYEILWFNKIKDSIPNYFYFKEWSYILESRIKYQKHKLNNILPIFNNELSENINMYNNGYRKIYDCWNVVYTFIKN